jgi:RNA polymerase sporulation-specific sigma factor
MCIEGVDNKMINPEDYLNLVASIARKRHKQFHLRYLYEDLFQSGCVGLMKAAKNFDESKGIQFSTYAYSFIDGYILLTVRDDRWYMCKREKRYAAKEPISIDKTIASSDGEDKELTLLDTLEDNTNDYEKFETRMIIESLLSDLPEKLRKVIELKYFYELNQTEIALQLETNQTKVSRLQKEALTLLRKKVS